MSGLGTDVVALACIRGGAAVGGVATAALDRGGERGGADPACAVETLLETPAAVVAMGGGEGRIVVAPRVRVRDGEACAVVVDPRVEVRLQRTEAQLERARARMEGARERMERARVRMERARVRVEPVERERLDRARAELMRRLSEIDGMDLRLDELDLSGASLELDLDELGAALESQIESEMEERLAEEMKRLEARLDRLGRDIGR
ncbi:MAG TPA: hypothetical protein VK849_10940 [Longimicrobiales bacterium]|nr:hypothetical protein [Longimicrobiales bacterium]